jgi:hypothetical protein
MRSTSTIIVAALALALHGGATAFSVSQSNQRHATTLCAEPAARRAFLNAALTAAVGVVAVSPAFADDDLSMPTTAAKAPEMDAVGIFSWTVPFAIVHCTALCLPPVILTACLSPFFHSPVRLID